MIDKIKLEVKELEMIINSLEILLAKIEIDYAAGEISQETYEKESQIVTDGINTFKSKINEMKGILEAATETLPLTEENLRKILRRVPCSEAFYFYADYQRYTGRYARSIEEFVAVIKDIEAQSLSFHLKRGDFQSWFRHLGDYELAKRLDSLKDAELDDVELRERLSTCVEKRIMDLRRVLMILHGHP